MTKGKMAMVLVLVMCLCWLTGCGGGPSAESSAEALTPPTVAPDESLPSSADHLPSFPSPDDYSSGTNQRPPDEVIAAIDEAGEMEPFFQTTDEILLLWPETDEVMSSPLRNFIGGWGVVLSDGTIVLNEARCHAIYDENGQPMSVEYESLDHTATIVVGLDLPEDWRGLTLTIIAPMDEDHPYYVGTGLPRTMQDEDAPHKDANCGLWYWQDDGYVRVFDGVDHGETFSFEPATVEVVEAV